METTTLKLRPEHIADLRRSGLSDATIEAAGFHSATCEEAKALLGFYPVSGGWVIPYPHRNGLPDIVHFKPDIPSEDRNGKTRKYLFPLGAKNRIYVPPMIPMESLQGKRIPLWIVEGEKKALKGAQEGLVCIAIPGVWNWRYRDENGDSRTIPDLFDIWLDAREVFICFDSDVVSKSGVARAEFELAQKLRLKGAKVSGVRFPTEADGEKVGLDDYLLMHTVEELQALPLDPLSTPLEFTNGQSKSLEWPTPESLPLDLQPVEPVSPKLLPDPLRSWLEDITDRFQCPLEFPTIGAIIGLAALIGRRVGIRPKREDDWLVVPNLWGGVVGRPGIMKTPALGEALKPLNRLAAKAHEAHNKTLKEFEAAHLLAKVVKDAKIKEATKAKTDMDRADLIQQAIAASEVEPPIPVRYIVNDSTVEKLGELLNQNTRGLLLFRDELTGWLRTLDREGHENDRAFYLEAWNGAGRYTYDRIGRGTLHIEAACVSILGGIQPGPLGDYLRRAVKGGLGDDGLMQRFQLLVYPNPPKMWKNVDRKPNTEVRDRVYKLFEALDTADPTSLGAARVEDDPIPFFKFSNDAQDLFDEWRKDLETKIRATEEHPVMEAHLAKYRSLMPSLALIFHLLDIADGKASGPVTIKSAALAAAWCDFLETHARRIYQTVTECSHLAARLLGDKIKAGKLSNPFTARQVYHNGWSGLTTPEDVERAADILDDKFWIRTETIPTAGRPRTQYQINPAFGVKRESRS